MRFRRWLENTRMCTTHLFMLMAWQSSDRVVHCELMELQSLWRSKSLEQNEIEFSI
jgi:hypothetical protein